jgi:hypothetical protein
MRVGIPVQVSVLMQRNISLSLEKDRGKVIGDLAIYRWMSRAGGYYTLPMKVKVVNYKPVNRSKGTL